MPQVGSRYTAPFTISIENIGGMFTSLPPHAIPSNKLVDALNFYRDYTGKLSTRWGTEKVFSSTLGKIDNIGGFYLSGSEYILFSVGNEIYRMDTGTSIGTVDSTGNIVSFIQFLDKIFFLNGGDVYSWDGTIFQKETAIPKANMGLVMQSRLWLAGDPSNPNTLYYSGINDVTDWSSDGGYYIIDSGDGDVINAIDVLNEDIIVFKGDKHKSIYQVVLGLTPSDTEIKKLVTGASATGKFATSPVLNDMVFYTEDNGLQTLRRLEKYGLTKTIAGSIDIQDRLRYSDASMVRYSAINSTILYSGSDIWVANYNTGDWYRWSFQFNHSCFSVVDNELYIGDTTGNIYKLSEDEFTDDGDRFEKYIQTKFYSGVLSSTQVGTGGNIKSAYLQNVGNALYKKYFRFMRVYYEVMGGGGSLYCEAIKDLDYSDITSLGNVSLSTPQGFAWDVAGRGWDKTGVGWDAKGIASDVFYINDTADYLSLKLHVVGDIRLKVLGFIINGAYKQKIIE